LPDPDSCADGENEKIPLESVNSSWAASPPTRLTRAPEIGSWVFESVTIPDIVRGDSRVCALAGKIDTMTNKEMAAFMAVSGV